MTNGEKIKEIFPEAQIEYGESDVYVWLNHEPVNFSREAWESNYSEVASELAKNSKKLEKDFGELDCISREDALDCVNWGYSFSDIYKKINELPSVTPQELKTGHWIAYEVRLPDRTILNYRCSVCGRKLIGYNTETLSEAPFCHCGAKMVEPQESEVMGNANGNN